MQAIIEAISTPSLIDGAIALQAYVPPEVKPVFDGPGSGIVREIAGWIHGLALTVSLVALIVGGLAVSFRGFGNQFVQQNATKILVSGLIGVALLGSIYAIYAWSVNLDLGL